MTTYHLIEVKAARKVPSRMLYQGRWKDVDIDEWDKTREGVRLRELRFGKNQPRTHQGLREFAGKLGLSASDLSGLEFGKYTLSTEEWQLLLGEASKAMVT